MIQTVFNNELKKFEEKLRFFQAEASSAGGQAGGQATQVKYNAVIQKLKEDGVPESVLTTFTLNQCLSAHGYQ